MKTLFLIFPVILLFIWGCNNNPGKTKTEKIDHVFEKAFNDGDFVGNVLIADKGKVIYKKCFGKSDAESNLPNTDSTKFLIASISKPITAILILQLVDEGKLKLDDSVDKYLSVA